VSSDYSYINYENIETRPKSSGKIEKGLKKLFIIAGIIFAAELIWLFGVTPFVPFSVIEVQGIAGLEKADVLGLAGIDETSSFFSTNISEVQDKLAANILVESVLVTKRFPDKLSIFLSPRRAAAVVFSNIDSRQVPLYVDRNGVVFKTKEVFSQGETLPILSGFENPRLNMRLPAALVPLTESIYGISSSSPELLAAISEIRIEHKAWEGFDLVLFPVHSDIKVRVENNLTEDLLRYVLLMLNVFENSSPRPEEIDFRSGMGSYRIKEPAL